MHIDGFAFSNSNKFIEQCLSEGQKAIDIVVNGNVRVALMTDDVPLKDVPAAITQEAVVNRVKVFAKTLQRDFRISCPRIAVMALNPNHSIARPAKEETEAIIPAVNQLVDEGICVFGPYLADAFFGNGDFTAFDGILAMYHDQGAAPFHALLPQDGIHYLGGLPLVCTAADQGPGYVVAGKNEADATSFRHAIWQAIDAFRNRTNYDEPLANPLPKLYHERKDESEKVRFSIPKKREGFSREQRK